MNWKVIALSLLVAVPAARAQEDFCGKNENKKIKKIYEKLYGNITDKERLELLREAMEIDEYCTQCNYDYARLLYYKAKESMKDNPYGKAKEQYQKTLELCPTYHADIYFSLAMIARYEEDNESAVDYIDKFVEFKCDENNCADNHQDKFSYLKALRKDLVFWRDWHANVVDFDPERVPNISSQVDEYLPMLSPDNELMYFTRKEKKSATGVIDGVAAGDHNFWEPLYQSARADLMTEFDAGTRMEEPFNADRFVGLGGVTISVDNHEMIICGCENIEVDLGDGQKQRYKNCDLFSTSYERVLEPNGQDYVIKWTELTRLGGEINTEDGWEATPTMSGDGKTLYFAAVRPGMKDIDIFYSKRQEDGSWSRGKRLRAVNSNGDDKAPFMHADSHTLYFVSGPSNQHEQLNDQQGKDYQYERKNVGGFDLYYIKQNDDGTWGKPQLMAKPINTQWDELGLIVSTDGHTAYFATNRLRGSGGSDVYRFSLYEEAKPRSVTLFKGEVKKKDGSPNANAVVEVKKKGSDEKVVAKVNDDGKYAVVVAKKKDEEPQDLIVTVKEDGHAPTTQLVTVDQQKEVQKKQGAIVKVREVTPEPIRKDAKFTIEDILYATNSYELTSHSKFVLDQFVAFLKENPTMRIEVQGHTDDVGDATKNKILSDNRASGVREYLIASGIPKARLTHRGYGEDSPKVKNDSPANRAKNRRTVFKVLSL